MIFKGKNGTSYKIIEPAIGKGGEGSIYKIDGMPNFVLKVFADSKRTQERERKLLAMIASTVSNKIMKHVTWPKDVVYKNGRFTGYVMPKISNNKNLNIMYVPSKYNNKDKFIKKIKIAMNLCAAINSVHNAGQVCGDFNPNNITVNPYNGMVTLVDTDSYHITERNVNRNRVYRCEVGMPEYLAPEIHKKLKNNQTLSAAPLPTFTKQTDLFALAVHIFALLMNGCHPFASAIDANAINLSKNSKSVAAPQPMENIRNGFFPFYMNGRGFTIPKYAPDFNQLPEEIRKLFIRAFVDGHKNPQIRPDTLEWYKALKWYIKQVPQPSLFASKTMFWFLTVIITLGLYILYNNMIINNGLNIQHNNMITNNYYSHYSNSSKINLIIQISHLGVIICGLIGTVLYNTLLSKDGKIHGYKWHHYFLSVFTSFIGLGIGYLLFTQ